MHSGTRRDKGPLGRERNTVPEKVNTDNRSLEYEENILNAMSVTGPGFGIDSFLHVFLSFSASLFPTS